MALGYFPAVTVLLLLEMAKITGGTITRHITTTSPIPPEPRPFASVPETTSAMGSTSRAAETNGPLPSSVALLSETTGSWSTVGETSLPGVATTVPSTSAPEGSTNPPGTRSVAPTSSSFEFTSIFTTAFGTTHPAESTMVVTNSTTQEMTSSPRSPTPQDKRTSESPSTIIAITTQEESTSEQRLSSPPFTTETMKTSPLSIPLPTPTVATSTLLSASSGVGDTTVSSSQVTTGSEAEITSWWPRISPSSTSSSVTQDKSTPKATSTGLPSSNSGRTSLGLSAPSPSTNPTSQYPATPFEVLSSTPTSPSASTSLPETPGGATTRPIAPLPIPPEPRPFASVSEITSAMETTTPSAETNGPLPSSVALLSETTSPRSTVGETSLPGVATTVPSSSSPEGSTNAPGTRSVSPTSSSLEFTSIFMTAFGTTHPAESTMVVTSSTTQEMTSSPRSSTPQDKRTSESPSTIIAITTQEELTSEQRLSSPPFTTETMKTSPLSVPLPTPTVATSTLLSASSGVGDTTGSSSQLTTSSEVDFTSWWPRISPSLTSSSVTQDKSTPKAKSAGLPSSNSGRTRLGLSAPSPSTNLSSQYPATPFKVLSSTPTSPSASTILPETPARTRFILSVRFSTQLNITDPSVSRAVQKWLKDELQAKFPLGSFTLNWIG